MPLLTQNTNCAKQSISAIVCLTMLHYVTFLINLNLALKKCWQYQDIVYNYKAEILGNQKPKFTLLESVIPVADRARLKAWPAAAIVRSRVCVCAYYLYCMCLALLTSV